VSSSNKAAKSTAKPQSRPKAKKKHPPHHHQYQKTRRKRKRAKETHYPASLALWHKTAITIHSYYIPYPFTASIFLYLLVPIDHQYQSTTSHITVPDVAVHKLSGEISYQTKRKGADIHKDQEQSKAELISK
jgi:hypothetical protein